MIPWAEGPEGCKKKPKLVATLNPSDFLILGSGVSFLLGFQFPVPASRKFCHNLLLTSSLCAWCFVTVSLFQPAWSPPLHLKTCQHTGLSSGLEATQWTITVGKTAYPGRYEKGKLVSALERDNCSRGNYTAWKVLRSPEKPLTQSSALQPRPFALHLTCAPAHLLHLTTAFCHWLLWHFPSLLPPTPAGSCPFLGAFKKYNVFLISTMPLINLPT